MGACDFQVTARGKNASAAFNDAVSQAQYDYGHAGYTGTIAEKDSFVEFAIPAGVTAQEFADMAMDGYELFDREFCDRDKEQEWYQRLLEKKAKIQELGIEELVKKAYEVSDDKWGPAACVGLEDHEDGTTTYLFFGWASS